MLQVVDTVTFIKLLRLSWYDHVERIGNQRMPKQIAASTMEGTRKRGYHVKDGQMRLRWI
jgi:hypothetical protein